ncbi:Surface antigen (D15) [Operophtera brumata]|uniref:Surface antigen (D15) n=1 Tax=Operophtera brumata TaxID=104452 RepID=A0A0L7LAZ1_OPEBR|nr:Surface antigen (D15) [Operophtera brumata]
MKRRSVLIINNGTNLRSFEKSSKKATSLLYEEYADDGAKINTVMMYSLDDVSAFFRTYLNTEICNVKCGDDDD